MHRTNLDSMMGLGMHRLAAPGACGEVLTSWVCALVQSSTCHRLNIFLSMHNGKVGTLASWMPWATGRSGGAVIHLPGLIVCCGLYMHRLAIAGLVIVVLCFRETWHLRAGQCLSDTSGLGRQCEQRPGEILLQRRLPAAPTSI